VKRAKRTRSAASIKRRFHVLPGHAPSLMEQAIKSMLAQEPLKPHVANYMIESMRLLLAGEDGNRAFALQKARGLKQKNRKRNIEISLRAREAEIKWGKQDAAFQVVAGEFLGDEGLYGVVKNAHFLASKAPAGKNVYGSSDADYYDDLAANFGKEVADEWLNSLG